MRSLLAFRALGELGGDLIGTQRGSNQLRAHLAFASRAVAGSALRLVSRRAVFGGESHSCHECKNSHTCDETFHGIVFSVSQQSDTTGRVGLRNHRQTPAFLFPRLCQRARGYADFHCIGAMTQRSVTAATKVWVFEPCACDASGTV